MITYSLIVVLNRFFWVPASVLRVCQGLFAVETWLERTSGEEILTPRILDKMTSGLSHIDSARAESQFVSVRWNEEELTKENDVNTSLVELFRQCLPCFMTPVISIIYDDLSTGVEEVPDQLFTSSSNFLPECYSLFALWTCVIFSDRKSQI